MISYRPQDGQSRSRAPPRCPSRWGSWSPVTRRPSWSAASPHCLCKCWASCRPCSGQTPAGCPALRVCRWARWSARGGGWACPPWPGPAWRPLCSSWAGWSCYRGRDSCSEHQTGIITKEISRSYNESRLGEYYSLILWPGCVTCGWYEVTAAQSIVSNLMLSSHNLYSLISILILMLDGTLALSTCFRLLSPLAAPLTWVPPRVSSACMAARLELEFCRWFCSSEANCCWRICSARKTPLRAWAEKL